MGIHPAQAQLVYDEVFSQLRLARQDIDRLRVQRSQLLEDNAQLAIECEALRDMLALLAASVGGAVL
jgi:regulator of replication initiation timing